MKDSQVTEKVEQHLLATVYNTIKIANRIKNIKLVIMYAFRKLYAKLVNRNISDKNTLNKSINLFITR